MAGLLADYALRLSQDPSELAAFKASPGSAREAMSSAGLSAAEQEVLLSGDQHRITRAIAADVDALTSAGRASATTLDRDAEPMEVEPEPMETTEHPGEPMEVTEHPGEPMEVQEHPGEPMEVQEHPGEPMEVQEHPGEPMEMPTIPEPMEAGAGG